MNGEERQPTTIKHFSKKRLEDYVTYKNISGNGQHADKVKILVHKKKDHLQKSQGKTNLNDFSLLEKSRKTNLKDLIVKKRYHKKHKNIFYNEIYWLLKLQKTSLFPKVIRVDLENLTFWMTYCGRTLDEKEFKIHEKKIKEIEIELREHHGCYHNDLKPANICIKGDKLFLIDCGWMSTESLLPGYIKGRYGHTNPDCFSHMIDKCLELIDKKPEIHPL